MKADYSVLSDSHFYDLILHLKYVLFIEFIVI